MDPLYQHSMIDPKKVLWACLGIPDHIHLNLHDQFITLTDMKLHAQNQFYTTCSF